MGTCPVCNNVQYTRDSMFLFTTLVLWSYNFCLIKLYLSSSFWRQKYVQRGVLWALFLSAWVEVWYPGQKFEATVRGWELASCSSACAGVSIFGQESSLYKPIPHRAWFQWMFLAFKLMDSHVSSVVYILPLSVLSDCFLLNESGFYLAFWLLPYCRDMNKIFLSLRSYHVILPCLVSLCCGGIFLWWFYLDLHVIFCCRYLQRTSVRWKRSIARPSRSWIKFSRSWTTCNFFFFHT